MELGDYLSKFKCNSCGSSHSVAEWNDNTLKYCSGRKERRQFKSLGLQSSRDKGSSRVYVCPTCGKFIKAKDMTPDTGISEN